MMKANIMIKTLELEKDTLFLDSDIIILDKKKLTIEDNPKLLEEVVDLVDNPNILLCSFNKKFLSIPKIILFNGFLKFLGI